MALNGFTNLKTLVNRISTITILIVLLLLKLKPEE